MNIGGPTLCRAPRSGPSVAERRTGQGLEPAGFRRSRALTRPSTATRVFTAPISAFTLDRFSCSRCADLSVHGEPISANKTDDPRSWALDAGVREALQRFRPLRGDPPDGAHVFVDDDGKVLSLNRIAARFRAALLMAGVDRTDLHEDTKKRQPTRVHDLRVAFVTVSLANGKSEAWVTDRTGHKSSTMIARYRRKARSVAEMHLGSFQPLYLAIPELAAFGLAPTWAQGPANGGDAQRNPRGTLRSRPVATGSTRFKISGWEQRPGSTPGGATTVDWWVVVAGGEVRFGASAPQAFASARS